MRFTVRHGLGRARLLAITGIVAILAGVTLGAIGTAGADEAPLDTTDPTTEVTPPTDPPAETPADAPADTPADAPADTPADAPADTPADVPTDLVQPPNSESNEVGAAVQPVDPPAGNNGDVKVHEEANPPGQTPDDDTRDVPHVCLPRWVGFNFDASQALTWSLDQQPPTGNAQQIASQNVSADGAGHFVVTNATIAAANGGAVPPGHYKLNWDTGEPGGKKFKVFWVDNCSEEGDGRDTPEVSSEVHNASHEDITGQTVLAGTTVHDKAIVTGVVNGDVPTFTVDFRFFDNDECTGEPTSVESDVALSEENGSAVAESTPQTPSLGAKAYQVHYNGDQNYTDVLGPCEPFDPSGEPPLTPPEVGGVAVTEAATGTLPFTGGGPGWQLPVGVLFVLSGALLLLVTRQRRTADLGS